MKPYNKNGTMWGSDTSNSMLRHVRLGVVDDLRQRDKARGITGSLYSDDGARMVVDVAKAQKKHTALETKKLTSKRWAEFCSVPQDEAKLSDAIKHGERQDVIDKAVKAALAIEDSLKNPNLMTPQGATVLEWAAASNDVEDD